MLVNNLLKCYSSSSSEDEQPRETVRPTIAPVKK